MKWSVNVRKKTLTICLNSWEVMELFLAIRQAVWMMGGDVPSILCRSLGRVVRGAMGAMFPQAFPGGDLSNAERYGGPEQVAWNEICDES